MRDQTPKPLPPYRVIRSNRRTTAIQVNADGELLLRLPMHASLEAAEQFLHSKRDWIEDKLRNLKPPVPEPDARERAALIEKALAVLPGRLAYWTQQLQVTCSGITITGAKKRFGSCSSKGRVCFSYLLMRYPDRAIDYVVLHEAMHLKHLNHGPAFHAAMARYMPDYREREALLKQDPIPQSSQTNE